MFYSPLEKEGLCLKDFCVAYGWTTVKQKIQKLKGTMNKVVVEISADLQYSFTFT